MSFIKSLGPLIGGAGMSWMFLSLLRMPSIMHGVFEGLVIMILSCMLIVLTEIKEAIERHKRSS